MKSCIRREYIYAAAKDKKTLSVGLGGMLTNASQSFNLNSMDRDAVDLSHTFSAQLSNVAASATFLDIVPKAIELFEKQVRGDYHLVDITTEFSGWPESLVNEKFDLIVLGEVIEHLANPGAALENMRNLLNPGGEILITVPSAFSLATFVKFAFGKEAVHPEHTCYYSPSTLAQLCRMSGLSCKEVAFAQPHRFSLSLIKKRNFGHFLVVGITKLLPRLSVGLVCVATVS